MRDPRYDILFEPVKIGPVTARNRFYQVPHCNGMGRTFPSSMAEMRRTKAEGGWAVICTEEIEIHPSADHTPWAGGRLWDDRDIPYHARMCEGIHEFGSLAGAELNHAGMTTSSN
ncbi:MAG: NADH:flavin oxidoreductase, partial [Pseudomonadota bacterium]